MSKPLRAQDAIRAIAREMAPELLELEKTELEARLVELLPAIAEALKDRTGVDEVRARAWACKLAAKLEAEVERLRALAASPPEGSA